MDVVYPLKKAGYTSELRHSMRSLANLPHDNVFVVGGKPPWLSDRAIHVPTVQNQGKYLNLCHNIEAACKDDRISDPFVIFNDDFFVTEPVTSIRPLWRETPGEALERYHRLHMTAWGDHLRRIMSLTRVQRSYELHVPMVVHKDAMREAVSTAPGPLWRTYYGALAGLAGTRIRDVKVMNKTRGLPPGPFASTADDSFSFGVIGHELKQLFPDPSPYER